MEIVARWSRQLARGVIEKVLYKNLHKNVTQLTSEKRTVHKPSFNSSMTWVALYTMGNLNTTVVMEINNPHPTPPHPLPLHMYMLH